MDHKWKTGLEDVVAARSAICQVDGEAGRLYYRGYEIGEVAASASFEDVTHLLWFGELPTPAQRGDFAARLDASRGLSPEIVAMLRSLPHDGHPLDALRTSVSLAATRDPDVRLSDEAANLRKAYRLMTLVPETVAAWQRIRTGGEPLSIGPAGEFNASTFAARVAVATMADLHAAMVAAIATLKGPRHGGANDDVLAMLHEIEDPARAEAFVEARIGARAGLSKRERSNPTSRVPGFGHRVYKVDDARARVLRGMAKELAGATGRSRLFEVAEGVYEAMRARTTLPVNVDFFSAVVYDALGIPPDLCTSIFAVGRIAGWCAHALEQYADNRLIRPRADYVGPAPRPLVPVAV